MDWRSNILPAAAELRGLRGLGLTVDQALDKLRGRGFTLPAVQMALEEVEGFLRAGDSA